MLLTLMLLLFQSPASTVINDEPLTLPAIVYPADARAARVTGIVHLEIHVDPSGRVTRARALDGPAQLRQAAVDAYSQATYRPLLKNDRPAPAVITTAVSFTLTDAPPSTDQQVNAKFAPLHARCQQLSLGHATDALQTCREAVAMASRFTPQAELEARATAYNDLVLLLITAGKKSPNLPEAGLLADAAVDLITQPATSAPHTPAVAVAYITRAEVRSLADNLRGAAADCAIAEDTLTTLLQDQGKRDAASAKRDEVETERAANYRAQLRETLLLHAIVLERDGKAKEAKVLRVRANAT